MGNHAVLHPTEQTLSDFSLGKLDDGRAELNNSHVNECPDCQRLVAEMSSDSFLGRLQGVQGRLEMDSSLAGLSQIAGEPASAEPPPASSLPPGLADHANYKVLRELGQGGMGTVYLAQNRRMGRNEVLKVISGHLIKRRGALDRFQVEIRNAGRSKHTNIVTAYSASRLGESIMFAMEYVEGLDLSKLVKAKGPLLVANACNYVHQACLGLQHAHEQGMVHRDIKPSNLMLTRQCKMPNPRFRPHPQSKMTILTGSLYVSEVTRLPNYRDHPYSQRVLACGVCEVNLCKEISPLTR